MYVCVCVCVYIYICVCVCVCMCVYLFLEVAKKADIWMNIYKHIPFRLFRKYWQHDRLLVRTVNTGFSLLFIENAEIWGRRNIQILLYVYKL